MGKALFNEEEKDKIAKYTKKLGIDLAVKRFDISVFLLNQICRSRGFIPKAKGYYTKKHKEDSIKAFYKLLPTNEKEYRKENMKTSKKRLRQYQAMVKNRGSVAKTFTRYATPLDLHALKQRANKN